MTKQQQINNLEAERVRLYETLEIMAEAARRLEESYRMTLADHGMSTRGHRAAFLYYRKAQIAYEEFKAGTTNSAIPEIHYIKENL